MTLWVPEAGRPWRVHLRFRAATAGRGLGW